MDKQTVIITGTSSGVGRVTAKYFSEKDWNVIATMRSPQKEMELVKLNNVYVLELDVRKPETIELAIQKGTDRFGKIDVVVNAAAYGQYGMFEAISPEQIQAEFDTNVFGYMNVIRAILPSFRSQKHGMVINISSAGGRIAIPGISVYIASKFAIEGFSESLSYELASQNIILKLIEPGGIDTNFHKISAKKLATKPGLTAYDDFVKSWDAHLSKLAGYLSSPETVAEAVYTAATDGTETLRYIVGDDAKGWIKARTSLPDKEYMEYMHGLFST